MLNPAHAVQANADFQLKVATWQRKLGAVDTVLSSWADVQRKWQGLQSIFIGSADIRVQLPEDSARFDGLNGNFEVLQLTLDLQQPVPGSQPAQLAGPAACLDALPVEHQ